MSHRYFSPQLLWVAVIVVAGLGFGYGASRWWKAGDAASAQAPSKLETTPAAQKPTEQPRNTTADAAPTGKHLSKRALLVGVTTYDNLPKDKSLVGPGNDAELMRDFLQKYYGFPAEGIVTLTEHDGAPARRPTRANIEREFRRLADGVHEGDQVVILLAGHGGLQPESDPPDKDYPEPDGIDKIFLPADVGKWNGPKEKCPHAIRGGELGAWLKRITTKKASVWIVFDCCHSGTMTRSAEVARELPPGFLVPEAELDKARQRAAQRSDRTRGEPAPDLLPYVPREPSDYLVALYACRSQQTTPESVQPAGSPGAVCHGLLTYSLVNILEMSATSKAPLTYRELVQRLQLLYAARPQNSPTPLGEGKGQDRVVLGTQQPARPRLLVSRDDDGYKVNAGDLYGLTSGSVLAVYSPAGTDKKPVLLGHVCVGTVRPFEAEVEPCAYANSPLVKELPPLSTCKPVFIDYGLHRFKVAVQVPEGQEAIRQKLLNVLEPLSGAKDGLVEKVDSVGQAEWLIRFDKDKLQLVVASGKRAPFALPAPDSPDLGEALRKNLEKIYRARNLIAIANGFEKERYRGDSAVDVEVEVLLHKNKRDKGEVLLRPPGGWVFHSGDLISFRVHNKSELLPVNVTLLMVGAHYQIEPFYPQRDEVGVSVSPGKSLDTPLGRISKEPPFGNECLVVIAVPETNPPADFSALAQDGLVQARSADGGKNLKSPLGQLLESAMFRSGSTRGLDRVVADQQGMRVLRWQTEPAK